MIESYSNIQPTRNGRVSCQVSCQVVFVVVVAAAAVVAVVVVVAGHGGGGLAGGGCGGGLLTTPSLLPSGIKKTKQIHNIFCSKFVQHSNVKYIEIHRL